MNIYEAIYTRASRRAFLADPVDDETLVRLLEAARIAPSAANCQPWHFYVVRDAATRSRLFPTERQAWIAAAPVIVVACSTPRDAWVRKADGKVHADIDIAIAMEHIVLAATEEGLGTCWICSFDPQNVREVLQLPAEMEPIAITPIGYSSAPTPPHNRKALEDIVTWL